MLRYLLCIFRYLNLQKIVADKVDLFKISQDMVYDILRYSW